MIKFKWLSLLNKYMKEGIQIIDKSKIISNFDKNRDYDLKENQLKFRLAQLKPQILTEVN